MACAHVGSGHAAQKYLLNKPILWLLCDPCYWGEHPFPEEEMNTGGLLTISRRSDEDIAKLGYTEYKEEEAVRLGWIPKSLSLQRLLALTNDTTAGLAVSSWPSRLRGALCGSGLFLSEKIFLFRIFGRGETDLNVILDAERQGKECPQYTGPGFGELDDEEESEANRILNKRSANLRAEESEATRREVM